jgi:hypothetical protein
MKAIRSTLMCNEGELDLEEWPLRNWQGDTSQQKMNGVHYIDREAVNLFVNGVVLLLSLLAASAAKEAAAVRCGSGQ